MAAPFALYGPDKERLWEIGGGLENMRNSLQDNWKPPADYRWQSLKTESWNQPTAFGGLIANTERERLLQEAYLIRQGNVAPSHLKSKSQSLPRVLSPESLKHVEMPSLINSKHCAGGGHRAVGLALETSKCSNPRTPFLALSKPKYGRPLKPPSYELHQQTRGSLESNSLQEDQQKDKPASYLTKVNEQIQDSSLAPPLYIPPPCYKSPGQQSMAQHSSSEAPAYEPCFDNILSSPEERIFISSFPSTNIFQIGSEQCKREQILPDHKRPLKQGESYLSTVQYIPFDDPRIRHIKISHPVQKDGEVSGSAQRTNTCVFHKSFLEEGLNHSFSEEPDSAKASVQNSQGQTGSSVYSSRRLVESSVDQNSCALSTQRDSCGLSNNLNCKHPKSSLSAQSPMEFPCETVTKVKTFEPGTEIQSRKSSKKKTSETIFCLVSIPVPSEQSLPDTDTNNNVTQGALEKNGLDSSGVLQEQSLLSTSSTDLELQALTGNITNKNNLQKQEWWSPDFKQMSELRVNQAAKHRELQYSGSWPGDQYKDQQTQTSFMEELQTVQLQHGLEASKPNTPTTSQLQYGSSTTESDLSLLPANDRKRKQVASTEKGHWAVEKPSPPEHSRNVILSPKALCQNDPCASGTSLPGQEREPRFAHKEEGNPPCSSKELFGQFLLKPVSRRPWDVISELESFNKELQEQEENNEEGAEKQDKQGREEEEEEEEERKMERNNGLSQGQKLGVQSETVRPDIAVFKQGREKVKSETFSASESPHSNVLCSDRTLVRSKERDQLGRTANEYVTLKPPKQEGRRRVVKRAISLYPVKTNVSSNLGNENHCNPFNNTHFGGASDMENYRDNVVDFDKLRKNTAVGNKQALERGSIMRLSLTNRNQGHSEPDLRSLGLNNGEGSDTLKPDSCTEIPPNESLQARAARILGIEVAVESLIPKNIMLPDDHHLSDNMPQSFQMSAEKKLVGMMEAQGISYEGKQKCGWTESPLIGKNLLLGSVKDQNSGQEKLTAEQCFQHQDFSRRREDKTHAFESVVLPFAERNSLPPYLEKRARSTSQVIKTLQGKLASPSSRAAVDRLVRMKEVDSVSRMRRLSIKDVESGEDGDEDRQVRAEERGSDVSFGRSEFPRKLSHGGSVSKRIISLAENGLLDNRNEKRTGRDLFSLDAYDPSRVERV